MSLLILDRDGVINHDSDDYIRSVTDWQSIPGSIEAIADLSRAGFQVAIATNQSGLGRGYFELEDLEAIHEQLRNLVAEAGGAIACIAYCPHLPDANCDCRKPGIGLLRAIERELETPLAGAWFVGDSLKDLQAAVAGNCRPALVTTGKGQATAALLQSSDAHLRSGIEHPTDIPVYPDLARAAEAIIARARAD